MNAIDKIVRYFLLTVLWGGAFFFAGILQLYNPVNTFLSSVIFVIAVIFSKRAAWPVKGNMDKLARYGFLTTLWFVMFLFTIYAASSPWTSSYGSYMGFALEHILWLVALTTVIMTSFSLFPRYDQKQSAPPASTTAKRKNDHLPPVDPLDVLTDDDLEELRQEIKDEIRSRLRYGSDDAVSSLEELINDHQPPARAKRK